MTSTRVAFVCTLVAAFAFSGCGGVADAIATHQLDLHVSRHGHPMASRPVSVAMRPYENVPFTKPQEISTDASGQAHADFKTMWGSAFLIIPPIGSVPSHPPKPVYSVTVAHKQVFVSGDTPGVTCRWEHGSWRTEASVSFQ